MCLCAAGILSLVSLSAVESAERIGFLSAVFLTMLRKISGPLLLLAGVVSIHAATLQQLTMTQLVNASTAIVHGTVTASGTAMNSRTIFTHYTVQVSEQWKGRTVAAVDVALPGGALNGVRQSYPGVPALQIGGEYVLFLWTGKSGITQITGFHQGIYLVGSNTASRQASGELMVGPGGTPIADHPVSMGLSALKAAVATALQGGSAQ